MSIKSRQRQAEREAALGIKKPGTGRARKVKSTVEPIKFNITDYQKQAYAAKNVSCAKSRRRW